MEKPLNQANTDNTFMETHYETTYTIPAHPELNITENETENDLKNTQYEYVNHPDHYNNYSFEVIDMMTKIYGKENTALFCEMTAFKYRMRMGTKPNNPIQQDLNKESWYLNKAKQLRQT